MASTPTVYSADLIILQGTPGGVCAAISAARLGRSAIILERTAHVGGLPANGLGATDIGTRGATGGLFLEFVKRNKQHYLDTYGPDSPQVADCSDGYHFEPSIGEQTLLAMIAEHPTIDVRLMRQFDALPENVVMENGSPRRITILNRETGEQEIYEGKIFLDASYEGDLAAAAGVPFRVGREGFDEYQEPMAGHMYKRWREDPSPDSTYTGDDRIQAYNYRICLTDDPANQVKIEKPTNYTRSDYASFVEDLKKNRFAGDYWREIAWEGIGKVTNMVRLPNAKTDANNQHNAFVSTDLPEENQPWPTSDWAWRDMFAKRLREYILGLFWFVQNDEALPEAYRAECSKWGLAADEYLDNDYFPRQVYVREGRRIWGEHNFTAHDALPVSDGARPPIYENGITASHYNLDSHAVRKREPGRAHLDGFFGYRTQPYTVPFGVMVPKNVSGLLCPVPISGTHIGFSTIRMEPCWMAMGEAAGVAAHFILENDLPVTEAPIPDVQDVLIDAGAVLIWYDDTPLDHADFKALQYFGIRGLIPEWSARLDEPLDEETARLWLERAGLTGTVAYQAGLKRGAFLSKMHNAIRA